MIKFITSAFFAVFVFTFSSPLSAATITVAKDGSGQYRTIMAAIQAARPGDIVRILDASTYPEQVTIDSTKNGLTLTSANPAATEKPRIIWRDTVNVKPKTYQESLIDSLINYQSNGALRLLCARNVTIDGVAIDGGDPFCFGYAAVWNDKNPLQHGNGALTLWKSGAINVKNCIICNAYFGIYCCDFNLGGINANPNPADNEPRKVVPLSGFGKTGNHIIEYNRIHHNSIGLFFESAWDLGSIIRYNLIYENHHCSDDFAAEVKRKTSEGQSQPGGAMMFKDVMLSPLAIYNNTFWHNFLEFIGNWKAGFHHLVFNNIFGQPYRYFTDETVFAAATYMEICPLLRNRMNNCVFAAHVKPPETDSVTVFNGMPCPDSVNGHAMPGGLITEANSFPATADIRWIEIPFLSTDTASANFLVPDWNDTLVQRHIRDKGWPEAGVRDPDGSPADLGAIPQAGGVLANVATIIPTSPVLLTGNSATVTFAFSNPGSDRTTSSIKLLRWVRNLPYDINAWSSTWTAGVIPAADIAIIPVPSTPVAAGSNTYTVTIPAQTTDYAFLEMIVESAGSNSLQYTSTVGFIPYRKLDYKFVVDVLHPVSGVVLTEVRAGDTVVLRIRAFKADNTIFQNTVKPAEVRLHSGLTLFSTDVNPPAPLTLPDGVPGTSEGLRSNVMFTRVPPGNMETILVSGRWIDGSNVFAFIGSCSVTILPGDINSTVHFHRIFQPCREFTVSVFDIRGKAILSRTVRSSAPVLKPERFIATATNGLSRAVYLVKVTEKGKSRGSLLQRATVLLR